MKRGFTLIETVVVVGVLGLIMITTTNILVNAFRARNRLDVADIVETDGASVLRELSDNVIRGSSTGMSCALNASQIGSTLSIIGLNDGVVTNLICYEGSKIASESANGKFDLTSTSVKVGGCDTFAICTADTDTTDKINLVKFNFTLSSGDSSGPSEGKRTRSFGKDVVPRN